MNQMEIGAELQGEGTGVFEQVDRALGEIDRHEYILDPEVRRFCGRWPGSAGNSRKSSSGRKSWRFHDLNMISPRHAALLRLRNTGPFLLWSRRFLKVPGVLETLAS